MVFKLGMAPQKECDCESLHRRILLPKVIQNRLSLGTRHH